MRRQESVRNYNIPVSALPSQLRRARAPPVARDRSCPRAVSGIRSSQTTCRGILYAASRAAQNCRTARMLRSAVAPARRRRRSVDRARASGAPSTRTSATRRHRPQHLLDLLGLDLPPGDVDERRDAGRSAPGRRRRRTARNRRSGSRRRRTSRRPASHRRTAQRRPAQPRARALLPAERPLPAAA